MKRFASNTFGAAVLAALLVTVKSSNGVTWTEVGDAGQTIGTAQSTGVIGGQPLTAIFGTIGTSGDADIYKISVQAPTTFSATTVNALTTTSGLDTELYLFNSTGAAVYANDDSGASLRSTLPANNAIGPVTAGIYYLAIATSGNEPVNGTNQLLFSADSPSNIIRGPAAGVSGGESNFDSTFADPGTGAYEIDLTGALTPVPEISSTIMFGQGLLIIAIIAATRRRRRSL
jgi:hypothetical protein